MDNIKLLMKILKCGITGDNNIDLSGVSDAVLSDLYSLSVKHDLAHLVGYVLQKNNLLDTKTEIGKKFHKQMMVAVYRTTTNQYDYNQICQILNDSKIPFVPLKGAVIRPLYPEAWLRTSCDIDILVEEKYLKKTTDVLLSNGYKKLEKNFHDVPFVATSGTHIELHFNINELDPKLDSVLSMAWNYASCKEGCLYAFSNEFFIFHALAHIVCHIRNGGCGIRTVLDLWLILRTFSFDEDKLNELLAKAGIVKFYNAITKLTRVWFEGEEHSELTFQMQSYILTGGVYGTTHNKVTVSMAKKQNKFKAVIYRLFPPYSIMKSMYTKLEKYPILLPFYWIKRALKLIFQKGKAKSAIYEVKATKNVSQDKVAETTKMLEELGLN